MAKYDEARVIRSLAKKQVKVNTVDKTVNVPYGTTNLGNGSWGKIDFLCNHLGYVLIRTGKLVDDPNASLAFASVRELKKQERELQKNRRMKKND